ncbi:Heterokaryon incompatibility protein 6, OR allele [Pseudocercospora fuligena]|uniref:Heterokaryon incompatibility protein 6, OR allele n=1 Tax=Pseudocercospora fuligena TaxID=685502 RepID=A0A8H6RUR3_9PEZI|nr:Heterokaryon incompatibility protein 6, OR allele [Pseudocercospora fuligena]
MSFNRNTELVRPTLQDASTQIRLLRILPTEKSASGLITCELSTTSMASAAGRYVAISYTWGEETPVVKIVVNEQVVHVRHNCWYALWQMRLHNVSDLYWIDSLCIDQESHYEKQHQVGQMGDIFSQACCAACCIGETGNDSEVLWSSKALSMLSESEAYNLLFEFSQRDYFNRLWTVQECIVPPTLWLFCGSSLPLRWDAPDGFIDKIITATSAAPYLSTTMARFQALRVARGSRLHGEPVDPCTAVRTYCPHSCYDPRDKIYGLLSFMSPTIRERLQVDYSQPLISVLSRYAGIYDVLSVEGVPSTFGESCIVGSLGNMLRSIEALLEEFQHAAPRFRSDLDAFLDLSRLCLLEYSPNSRFISLKIGSSAFAIGETLVSSFVQRDCLIDMQCSHNFCTSALADMITKTYTVSDNFVGKHWTWQDYVWSKSKTAQKLTQKIFTCQDPRQDGSRTDPQRTLCIWRSDRETVAIFSVPSDTELDDYLIPCVDNLGVGTNVQSWPDRILFLIGSQERHAHGRCIDLIGVARPYYHRGKQWPITDWLPKDMTTPSPTLWVTPETLLRAAASPGFSRMTLR